MINSRQLLQTKPPFSKEAGGFVYVYGTRSILGEKYRVSQILVFRTGVRFTYFFLFAFLAGRLFFAFLDVSGTSGAAGPAAAGTLACFGGIATGVITG